MFTFVLKCNDDKTDENVDHEESDHNNVGDEKYGDGLAIIVNGTFVLFRRVDGFVEKTSTTTLDRKREIERFR